MRPLPPNKRAKTPTSDPDDDDDDDYFGYQQELQMRQRRDREEFDAMQRQRRNQSGTVSAQTKPDFDYQSDNEIDRQVRELYDLDTVAPERRPLQRRSTSTSAQASRSRPPATASSTQPTAHDPHQAGPEIDTSARRWPTEFDFKQGLRRTRGFEIVEMTGDGACLFRAVAYHVYSDQDMHGTVREACINYMRANRDHFSQFVTCDFDTYLHYKALPVCHGNHVEIQAMSEMYNRPVEVYAYDSAPINTFQSHLAAQAPIRLSYHNNNHYNAVIDPERPTFGVGLGLPQLEPGGADRALIDQARVESEVAATEQDMLAQVQALSSTGQPLDSNQHATTAIGSSSTSTNTAAAQSSATDAEDALMQAALQASVQQMAASEEQLLQQALRESRQAAGFPSLSLRLSSSTATSSVPSIEIVGTSMQTPTARQDIDSKGDDDDDDEAALLAAALAASVQDADKADEQLSAWKDRT
eukprot:TRINITY_DN5721_c0_g1_i2.p1 TRINITY_DN5721_c0_g1~~TRINITY_DN5721_c0_g1_i2.p1  ORF type:complete len:471 (+),score=107.90 TRINITY_DN5721_c0_g1_i2:102-1514(+)